MYTLYYVECLYWLVSLCSTIEYHCINMVLCKLINIYSLSPDTAKQYPWLHQTDSTLHSAVYFFFCNLTYYKGRRHHGESSKGFMSYTVSPPSVPTVTLVLSVVTFLSASCDRDCSADRVTSDMGDWPRVPVHDEGEGDKLQQVKDRHSTWQLYPGSHGEGGQSGQSRVSECTQRPGPVRTGHPSWSVGSGGRTR